MRHFSVNNISPMKRTLLLIIGVLALAGTSVEAAWFGAGVKPVPYVKVPCLKVCLPAPSAAFGPKAGTEISGEIDKSGASFALPWAKGGWRWPSITVGEKSNSLTIGPKYATSKKGKAKGKRKPTK